MMAKAGRFGFQLICSRSAGFSVTYHKMGREMPIKLPKEEQSTSHGLLLDLSMGVHLQPFPLIIILTVERTLDPCDLIDQGVCHTNPWCEADHHRKLNKRKKVPDILRARRVACASIYRLDSCETTGDKMEIFFPFSKRALCSTNLVSIQPV
ncbi:hypothetical protein BDV24DRAFT_125776 [Aspergillus arachidicola]|uniref:Uncharacterized protein n=1 Tax=Aspergillus arachidicola TaxID=656916 RepID=A0A5N6YIQ7_9EURO|nr:hypothetical protein BDV24DRAFT_125776 [Aspergillus arachidicola]